MLLQITNLFQVDLIANLVNPKERLQPESIATNLILLRIILIKEHGTEMSIITLIITTTISIAIIMTTTSILIIIITTTTGKLIITMTTKDLLITIMTTMGILIIITTTMGVGIILIKETIMVGIMGEIVGVDIMEVEIVEAEVVEIMGVEVEIAVAVVDLIEHKLRYFHINKYIDDKNELIFLKDLASN